MSIDPVSIGKFNQTIRSALCWLRANDERIEGMADLASHYKAPYLYAVLGDPIRARKYADLIRSRYLRPDGDFRTRPDVKGWDHLPCSPANRYTYSNGWLVVQKLCGELSDALFELSPWNSSHA